MFRPFFKVTESILNILIITNSILDKYHEVQVITNSILDKYHEVQIITNSISDKYHEVQIITNSILDKYHDVQIITNSISDKYHEVQIITYSISDLLLFYRVRKIFRIAVFLASLLFSSALLLTVEPRVLWIMRNSASTVFSFRK